jgi:hypothetical protein
MCQLAQASGNDVEQYQNLIIYVASLPESISSELSQEAWYKRTCSFVAEPQSATLKVQPK